MKYKDKYRQVWCLLLILLMKCKRNAKTRKSTRRQYNTMSGLLIQLVCQVRGCLTGREGKTFCWANLCSFWHRQQRKHWLQGKFIYINIKLFPPFCLLFYHPNLQRGLTFACLVRSSCWPLQCPRRGVLRKNWDGLSDFMIRTARVAIELLINLLVLIFFFRHNWFHWDDRNHHKPLLSWGIDAGWRRTEFLAKFRVCCQNWLVRQIYIDIGPCFTIFYVRSDFCCSFDGGTPMFQFCAFLVKICCHLCVLCVSRQNWKPYS